MWFVGWFEAHNGFVMALATLCYAFLTCFIVWEMCRSNELSKKLERSRIRPYVSLYAELRDYYIFVVLRNFGETPAFGLRLTPQSDSPSPFWKDRDIAVIKQPIAMLAPHQEIAEYLSSIMEVKKDLQTSDSLAFSCTVSYADQEGHAYGPETSAIDLSIYKCLAASNMPATFKNISNQRSLESIASSLTRVEGALNGMKSSIDGINSYLFRLEVSAKGKRSQ